MISDCLVSQIVHCTIVIMCNYFDFNLTLECLKRGKSHLTESAKASAHRIDVVPARSLAERDQHGKHIHPTHSCAIPLDV